MTPAIFSRFGTIGFSEEEKADMYHAAVPFIGPIVERTMEMVGIKLSDWCMEQCEKEGFTEVSVVT